MGALQSLFQDVQWDVTHRVEIREAHLHRAHNAWHGLDTNTSRSFDYEPNAGCPQVPVLSTTGQRVIGRTRNDIAAAVTQNAAECMQRCEAIGHKCSAAHFESTRRRCTLYKECLQRSPSPASVLMHRRGPSWPATPADVVWRTNASLVVANYGARWAAPAASSRPRAPARSRLLPPRPRSQTPLGSSRSRVYARSLRWLQTLPFGLVDFVVYNKYDFGRADAKPRVTRQQMETLLHTRYICNAGHAFKPPSEWASPAVACPPKCKCLRALDGRTELAYFTTLPNYGVTWRKPRGGSREPYVYLQFILDFWERLPPVVIFTQDDCLDRTCVWARALPRLSAYLERWQQVWTGEAMHEAPLSCFCRLMVEHNYEPKKYYWYPLMSFLQSRLLNATLRTRSKDVHWPMDANMAVGRVSIRANPRGFYETLQHLTTVESRCLGTGTIEWAHAFERLWMEFYDPRVPKVLKAQLPYGKCLLRGSVEDGAQTTPAQLAKRGGKFA